MYHRGRALDETLGPPGCNLQPNSEYCDNYVGSKSTRDNLRGREGKNPDRRLRSLKHAKWLRKLDCRDSQDVGLEAAII